MRSVSSFDRTLAVTTLLLVGFGLIILYSAGQTDVPTKAHGVWFRQMVWSGIGFVAALAGLPDLAPHPGVGRAGAVRLRASCCW